MTARWGVRRKSDGALLRRVPACTKLASDDLELIPPAEADAAELRAAGRAVAAAPTTTPPVDIAAWALRAAAEEARVLGALSAAVWSLPADWRHRWLSAPRLTRQDLDTLGWRGGVKTAVLDDTWNRALIFEMTWRRA